VNVVLPVAVNAQVSRTGQSAIVDMTCVAALLVVGPFELEVAYVVERDDVRERLGGVAAAASGTELPFVNFGFGVTRAATVAILRARLESHAGVAVGAAHGEVLSGQFVVALDVVVEDVLPGLEVTVLALLTEATSVGVIFGVAAHSRTVLRCLGKLLVRVTLNTLSHPVVKP